MIKERYLIIKEANKEVADRSYIDGRHSLGKKDPRPHAICCVEQIVGATVERKSTCDC